MDRYESAALRDFVATVIWPTRTVRLVDTPAGESEVNVIGTWVTATDIPMAWVNGNRISGVTWVSPTRVALGQTVALGKQVIVLVSPGSGSGYLPRNPAGVVAMLGDMLMGENRIRELGAAVESDDAVRLDQVQSLIQAALGGNYVAKSGDQMSGVLKLAAATALTDAAAAVRRDMVALLSATASAAERTFLAKPLAPATVDGDDDLVLTTKGWVKAQLNTALAAIPNHSELFTTPGTQYWTVPDGVTAVSVFIQGPGGGAGGATRNASMSGGYVPPGGGGDGISGSAFHAVTPGATVPVVVGGGGGGGYPSNFGNDAGGGGGGGGASSFDGTIIAGGGGGGGGSQYFSGQGGVGGAGGLGGAAGAGDYQGAGGAAGAGGTAQGGAGGAAASAGGDATFTRGSDSVAPASPPAELWPVAGAGVGAAPYTGFGQWPGPGANGANGAVLVMWRE